MDSPKLALLDVGHGNCAVLVDVEGVSIFDAGPGSTLLEFLDHLGIHEIQSVLISHAHEDHLAGVLSVLLNKKVRAVYVNPDSTDTAIWADFRIALAKARKDVGTIVHTELTSTLTGTLDLGQVHVEILAPMPEDALGGSNGADIKGKKQTANAMSAVVRLVKDKFPIVLLPGDIESQSLKRIVDERVDVRSLLLLFPHHGGRSHARDIVDFTKRLCTLVRPQLVLFSIGRGKHGTPRPEIIAAVREILPEARIACTQLSEHCAEQLPTFGPNHLVAIPAEGAFHNKCCAGSLLLDLSTFPPVLTPSYDDHANFIMKAAPKALCKAARPSV